VNAISKTVAAFFFFLNLTPDSFSSFALGIHRHGSYRDANSGAPLHPRAGEREVVDGTIEETESRHQSKTTAPL